jgi:hypothetical protein
VGDPAVEVQISITPCRAPDRRANPRSAFTRSTSAFAMSPPASSSAFLQSIMPAPVLARSSATSFAGISFTVVMLPFTPS